MRKPIFLSLIYSLSFAGNGGFDVFQYFGNIFSLNCNTIGYQKNVLEKNYCDYLQSYAKNLSSNLRYKYNNMGNIQNAYLKDVYPQLRNVCSGNANVFEQNVQTTQNPFGQQMQTVAYSYVPEMGTNELLSEQEIFIDNGIQQTSSQSSQNQANVTIGGSSNTSNASISGNDYAIESSYTQTQPNKLTTATVFDSSIELQRECIRIGVSNGMSPDESRINCSNLATYKLPDNEGKKRDLIEEDIKEKLGEEMTFLLDNAIYREKELIENVYNECLTNTDPNACIQRELYENDDLEKEIAGYKKGIEIGYSYKKKFMDALELDKKRINYFGKESIEKIPYIFRKKYGALAMKQMAAMEFQRAILRRNMNREKEFVDLLFEKMKKVAEPYIYAQSYTNMETLLATEAKK